MGISRGAIALLAEEAARRPYSGSIGTLGRQSINAAGPIAARQMRRFNLHPRIDLPNDLDDKTLFRAFGFDRVDSFDYSDYEGADYLLDLNAGTLPEGTAGQYDVVFDSGTLEHVFHVPNALKAIVSLAKIDGRIIMQSPSSNHLDHGFYMFSPTLFCDYFSANGLQINTTYLVRYSPNPKKKWDVYRYRPQEWDTMQVGGLDSHPYLIFIVATKTPHSTTNIIPQQRFYAASSDRYAGSRIAAMEATSKNEKSNSPLRFARALNTARRLPLAQALVRGVRRRLIGKELVGRY